MNISYNKNEVYLYTSLFVYNYCYSGYFNYTRTTLLYKFQSNLYFELLIYKR